MDSINPTTPQFPTEHPKRPPQFHTLFPGPQPCRHPEFDGSDCLRCEGCLTFADLTALEAEGLWVAASAVSATMRHKMRQGELLDALPAVCDDADELWQRRFVAAADAILVYLAAGLTPLPRCTAEEWVLCEIVTLLGKIAEDDDLPGYEEFANIDVERLEEIVLPTTHVLDLQELDDVEDDEFDEVLDEVLEAAAACCNTRNLLPHQWFIPHGDLEPWVPESFFS